MQPNLFHPLFYEGTVDIDKLTDPVKRKSTVGFINKFGQMLENNLNLYINLVLVMNIGMCDLVIFCLV